jgi:hypothetical protein
MKRKHMSGKATLLVLAIASSVGVLGANDTLSSSAAQVAAPAAQAPASNPTPKAEAKSPSTQPSTAGQIHVPVMKSRPGITPVHYEPNRFSRRANLYYALNWGVDSLRVKYAESGEIIRFSYHVLDPNKAAQLNDKKAEPALIDLQARVKLVVPTMEKVGQLRQSSTPVADRSYWMAFSNKGRLVKPGHRVSVLIGQFRADGLVVE